MTSDSERDKDHRDKDHRDKAEDAIRARESLSHDAEVGSNETVAPGFAGAGHLGPLKDFELTEGDEDVTEDGDGAE